MGCINKYRYKRPAFFFPFFQNLWHYVFSG